MTAARLASGRLELVSCTRETLLVDGGGAAGRAALGRLLNAIVPDNWPPELYDDDARRHTLAMLERDPSVEDWMVWYIVRLAGRGEPATAIGLVGYKGPPNADGVVEVGYGVLEQFRRRGYATEAVAALIQRAFADPRVTRVAAETYPELIPSIGVMEINGMRFVGPGSEERVIRYEIIREAYPQRRGRP